MYLLDTNIISLLAPARNRTSVENEIAVWLKEKSDDLYLSVITIAEIETGIARLVRTGASAKASSFRSWLTLIAHLYGSRIIELDLASARLAGRLFDAAIARGGNPGFPDAAIAAIAHTSDLILVTRNTAHFSLFETRCFNPYEWPPHA